MPYGKRGTIVRIAYLFVAGLFFIGNKLWRRPQSSSVVLCYHGVTGAQREKFTCQMRMIGRRAISTKNLNAIQENTHRAPTVCVTFDDAFANLVTNALPIINELQIPVTIFIATRSLGSFPIWLNGTKHLDASEKVMSVSQILELKENPLITFGSHTASHLHLAKLSAKDIREELSSSRNTLRQILNEHVDSLALPHGSFNNEVLHIAMEEEYKQIFTLEPVPFSPHNQSTPNRIGRFSMSPLAWRVEFFLTINGAYSWLYTWRSFIRKKINLRLFKELC